MIPDTGSQERMDASLENPIAPPTKWTTPAKPSWKIELKDQISQSWNFTCQSDTLASWSGSRQGICLTPSCASLVIKHLQRKILSWSHTHMIWFTSVEAISWSAASAPPATTNICKNYLDLCPSPHHYINLNPNLNIILYLIRASNTWSPSTM